MVLHSFAGIASGKQIGDGASPNGGLVLDSDGAVYGTTFYGGNDTGECNGGTAGSGCGIIFRLTPAGRTGRAWTDNTIYRFSGLDGANPDAGVTISTGNLLYGTAYAGGEAGNGVVYCLKPPSGNEHRWAEILLHRFKESDGANPEASLTLGPQGALFGTTSSARSTSGEVFEMKPPSHTGSAWAFTVLHGFGGSTDGAIPTAPLRREAHGAFFSTTTEGGTGKCGFQGCGTVYEIKPEPRD